ncbi:Rho GTPase-activating protein 8 [Smittium culicis]|uniref:Rho GTPase-activating protein 8 n=1 Tax=Smittium culicis TaxID=133412 RepID=A0A1R1YBE5_9FUNG|nr:Rho GTPase-activating protein 8 [Smittium culicis]
MKLISIPEVVKNYDLSVSHILVPPELIEKQTSDYGLTGKLFSKSLNSLISSTPIHIDPLNDLYDNSLKNQTTTSLQSDLTTVALSGPEIYLIPEPIIVWILYLFEFALYEEGLFRRSPSSVNLREAKQEFDLGIGTCDLDRLGGVHSAAVLLKMFFKELDDPVFSKADSQIIKQMPTLIMQNKCSIHSKDSPNFVSLVLSECLANFSSHEREITNEYINCSIFPSVNGPDSNSSINSKPSSMCDTNCLIRVELQRIKIIKEEILMHKSPGERQLLAHFFGLLYIIDKFNSINKMTSSNLSTVISPNLSFSDDLMFDMSMYVASIGINSVGSVVMAMISYFPIIFQNEIYQFNLYSSASSQSSADRKANSNIILILKNTLYRLKGEYQTNSTST